MLVFFDTFHCLFIVICLWFPFCEHFCRFVPYGTIPGWLCLGFVDYWMTIAILALRGRWPRFPELSQPCKLDNYSLSATTGADIEDDTDVWCHKALGQYLLPLSHSDRLGSFIIKHRQVGGSDAIFCFWWANMRTPRRNIGGRVPKMETSIHAHYLIMPCYYCSPPLPPARSTVGARPCPLWRISSWICRRARETLGWLARKQAWGCPKWSL